MAATISVGFAVQSQSDSEETLHGYRAWGRGLLERLRGMFAFALHDSEKRETLLARDPLGLECPAEEVSVDRERPRTEREGSVVERVPTSLFLVG